MSNFGSKMRVNTGQVEIPSIKSEPIEADIDHTQLHIVNVYSMNTEPERGTPGERSCRKSASRKSKKNSVPDSPEQTSAETATAASSRRYTFRKRTVQSYNDNLDPDETQRDKQKTKTRLKKQLTLPCDICHRTFSTQEQLEEHVVDTHVVDKEFECSKCTKYFISQEKLDSHLLKHHETRETSDLYPCKTCGKTFNREDNLSRHMKSYHVTVKPYGCTSCPKTFSRADTFRDHLLTHSDAKTIVCEHCKASFKTKRSLNQHRMYCSMTKCEMKLSKEGFSYQKNGIKTSHYKQHKCTACGRIFMTNANLKKHMIVHDANAEKRFKCDLCSNAYKRKTELTQHCRNKHGDGVKNGALRCPSCWKTFCKKKLLKDHICTNSEVEINKIEH